MIDEMIFLLLIIYLYTKTIIINYYNYKNNHNKRRENV